MLSEFQDLSREWIVSAEKAMSMADAGNRDDAIALLDGPMMDIGRHLSTASDEWIQHNNDIAVKAGQEIHHSHRGCPTGPIDRHWRWPLLSPEFWAF